MILTFHGDLFCDSLTLSTGGGGGGNGLRHSPYSKGAQRIVRESKQESNYFGIEAAMT